MIFGNSLWGILALIAAVWVIYDVLDKSKSKAKRENSLDNRSSIV